MRIFVWFLIVILSVLGKANAGDNEQDALRKEMVNFKWKYEHPHVKELPLRFYADGRAVSEKWTGTWTITGPLTVEIYSKAKGKCRLTFDPSLRRFTGVHFDSRTITGTHDGQAPKADQIAK